MFGDNYHKLMQEVQNTSLSDNDDINFDKGLWAGLMVGLSLGVCLGLLLGLQLYKNE